MKFSLPHILLLFMLLTLSAPGDVSSATNREQEIRELVTSFIIARSSGMNWTLHINRISINRHLKMPEGKMDYEIIAPQQWEGWGKTNLTVIIRQNDRVIRNISVTVDVEAKTDMVVALHQIEYGDLLTEADVVVQEYLLSPGSRLAARSLSDVVGKKARTTLKANQPVRSDQVERVPLIKAGQMVTIIAENEVLKVAVSGKARSAGAEGDTISVQNLTSLKEIPARVISATTVQVAF
ncbi:MAG: flagellar basal body P-ring formation chaperone FlgA [Desulfuromonadaceae bacterium]|nr:flagellar basal body P-ring formation chaperone FlgA [Desulfuromonadaceae bacterium]MDD2854020.1 flagellar basal body P-ring formation chaperone FlgA [Desulfuromonadaceae bacterium]